MTPLAHTTSWLLSMSLRASVLGFAVALISFSPRPLHADQDIGDSRVLGYQQCIDCHELPAEAWLRSSHASRSLSMLSTNSRAARYARRLGIDPSKLAHDSVCTDCHGTRQQSLDGAVHVDHGVSCESCHGPAGTSGGSVGWYELHSGEEELVHTEADLDVALREAGMAGVNDLYLLAVRCYECHSVSNEQVVAAGHLAGTSNFELSTWFSGEVRHNFAPYTVDVDDDEVNGLASNVWLSEQKGRDPAARRRLMYVVGQLADLEVNLRNRGSATKEGTFAAAAANRSLAAQVRLNQVAQRTGIAELLEASAAANSVREIMFLPPCESQESNFAEAAEDVARAARRFMTNFDGTDLEAIETLLPLEAKGQAFQP